METRKYTTGEVRKFDRKQAEETREIEFVISDNSKDRHGTVIPIDAWDLTNFNKNGIVGYQHEVYGGWDSTDPDRIIGVGRAYVEDDQLIGVVKFEPAEINPFAEKIFQKVLHGTLKATSVGFRETVRGKWGEGIEAIDGKNPTYYFGKAELLEFSIVNIPSNPNALRRSVEKESELDQLTKQVADLQEDVKGLGAQLGQAQNDNDRLKSENDLLKSQVRYYKNKRG